jgi:hypothetical protein
LRCFIGKRKTHTKGTEVTKVLTQKPKIRDKPQIPQISQMTEAKELDSNRRKDSSGKKVDGRDPVPASLICEICEICGFKFGI